MRGLVLILLALATPVAAQSSLSTEVSLRHQLGRDPDDRVAMVNLAGLYVRSGRPAKAYRLYRGLLGLENVVLERADGAPVWSHQLAEAAMRTNPLRSAAALTSR